MALLDDTSSTKPKRTRSFKANPSSGPSSGMDSATLQTIQSLQRQIADLDAKEEARGELTKAQAAKLDALETELTTLKNTPASADTQNAGISSAQESDAGRMAPWCPW